MSPGRSELRITSVNKSVRLANVRMIRQSILFEEGGGEGLMSPWRLIRGNCDNKRGN